MLVLDYKHKLGTIDDGEGRVYDLFQGNCLAGFTMDGEEDGQPVRYLAGFWSDKDHLTNCLGLTGAHKGDNIHKNWTKISLNTAYKESKIIAEQFIKTKGTTIVELFYKEI